MSEFFPPEFNALSATQKWKMLDFVVVGTWHCSRCGKEQELPPEQPVPGTAVLCTECEFRLCDATGQPAEESFGWLLADDEHPIVFTPGNDGPLREYVVECMRTDVYTSSVVVRAVNAVEAEEYVGRVLDHFGWDSLFGGDDGNYDSCESVVTGSHESEKEQEE